MPLTAEDRIAITEVIARYCHATDSGDGKGVAEQFTEDGILEITGSWQARGHAQITQIGDFPNKPKHWVNSIVIEGNGSTASSVTYYAAIGHGGPLHATGIYESKLTKQLNGRWKLLHHCYTGDPVLTERGAQQGRPRSSKSLTLEDRVTIMDLSARYNRALGQRDAAAFAATFVEDGELEVSGKPLVKGRAALIAMVEELPDGLVHHWSTNFIIEGTPEEAQARSYYAVIRDNRVVSTGRHLDILRKVGGAFVFAKRQLVLDEKPTR